jgi:sulfide:quinone oxidoreductase
MGARAISGVPGALIFRDQRDLHLMRRLVGELDAGTLRRVVFAVPSGCSWPLPLYELALLCAKHAEGRSLEVEVSLVTPERTPLELFGAPASRLVGDLLAERGVRFLGSTAATGVRRDGSLAVAFDAAIKADRVLAVPQLRGRRITGVPASWWGVVPVNTSGRVEGLSDVYAAGDITTSPVKQGGLAAQQADRIAHTIAASLGAPVREPRATHILQARLVGGDEPIFLRTELDWQGRPTGATVERTEQHSAASSTKVFGRYLTPFLETTQPLAA